MEVACGAGASVGAGNLVGSTTTVGVFPPQATANMSPIMGTNKNFTELRTK